MRSEIRAQGAHTSDVSICTFEIKRNVWEYWRVFSATTIKAKRTKSLKFVILSSQKRQNPITEVRLGLWALNLKQVYADIKTLQYSRTFLHISNIQTNTRLVQTPCDKSCYVMSAVCRYQPLSLILSYALGVSEDAKHGSNVIQVFVSVPKALWTCQHWMKLHPYTKESLVRIEGLRVWL